MISPTDDLEQVLILTDLKEQKVNLKKVNFFQRKPTFDSLNYKLCEPLESVRSKSDICKKKHNRYDEEIFLQVKEWESVRNLGQDENPEMVIIHHHSRPKRMT